MKPTKLLGVGTLLLLATVPEPATAAYWVYVGESDRGATLYYDSDTVRRSGDQVIVWEMRDHSRDSSAEIRKSVSRYRYDCAARNQTLLSYVHYFPNGKSRSADFQPYEQKASTIFPESIAEVMLDAVCAIH